MNIDALPAFRSVLKQFPSSQHCPVLLTLCIQIPIVNPKPIISWNFQKPIDSSLLYLLMQIFYGYLRIFTIMIVLWE